MQNFQNQNVRYRDIRNINWVSIRSRKPQPASVSMPSVFGPSSLPAVFNSAKVSAFKREIGKSYILEKTTDAETLSSEANAKNISLPSVQSQSNGSGVLFKEIINGKTQTELSEIPHPSTILNDETTIPVQTTCSLGTLPPDIVTPREEKAEEQTASSLQRPCINHHTKRIDSWDSLEEKMRQRASLERDALMQLYHDQFLIERQLQRRGLGSMLPFGIPEIREISTFSPEDVESLRDLHPVSLFRRLYDSDTDKTTKEKVKKVLHARGWRYHLKYKKWFIKEGAPTIESNLAFERGQFLFWDEKLNRISHIQDFLFEYSYMGKVDDDVIRVFKIYPGEIGVFGAEFPEPRT